MKRKIENLAKIEFSKGFRLATNKPLPASFDDATSHLKLKEIRPLEVIFEDKIYGLTKGI